MGNIFLYSTVTSQQPLGFGVNKAVKSVVPNRLEFWNILQKVQVIELKEHCVCYVVFLAINKHS